jgi:demethylmenaquinone methyltransferase/2-methoxy-6-polyprenyl-1,4-benzoquinol methylase
MAFRLPTALEKDRYVHNQFERIAFRYDLTNDAISLGMHRLWKKAAVDALLNGTEGSYLDVCCGTGDLAMAIAGRLKAGGQVTGLDFSANMLSVAARRAAGAGNLPAELNWIEGDAQNLPFADNTFDGAIISFGLRNLTDLGRGVEEMSRVVKRGGRVINLDVGHPDLPVFTPAFKLYFRHVVPLIGELLQNDRKAYTYLPESAAAFPPPDEIAALFEAAGLKSVVIHNLALGSVSMQVGTKA